jgi:hypothetical protein
MSGPPFQVQSAECGMRSGVDKVSDKVNSPSPCHLPGGEGEPSAALGLMSDSGKCHHYLRLCGGSRSLSLRLKSVPSARAGWPTESWVCD